MNSVSISLANGMCKAAEISKWSLLMDTIHFSNHSPLLPKDDEEPEPEAESDTEPDPGTSGPVQAYPHNWSEILNLNQHDFIVPIF